MIQRRGSHYVLKTKDGSRVLGTHKRKADAIAQENAIRVHQAMAQKGAK